MAWMANSDDDVNTSKAPPERVVIELSSSSEEDEDYDDKKKKKPHSIFITNDDDDGNEHEEGNENKKKVNLFMEICGVKDRMRANRQLQEFDYDLDRSVTAYFDLKQISSATCIINSEGDGRIPNHERKHKHNHSSDSEEEVKVLENSNAPKRKSSGESESTSQSTSTSISIVQQHEIQVESNHDERKAHASVYQQPSEKWESIMQRCIGLQVQFIDQDFPPNTTSLDGRKLQNQNPSSACTTSISTTPPPQIDPIKCHCGIPATIRAVQKDGPNYGRFYLSCGRPRPRPWTRTRTRRSETNGKRKRKDEAESDKFKNDGTNKDGGEDKDNDKEKGEAEAQNQSASQQTSSSTRNNRDQCRFFQWDDNHVQDNSKGRNAWTHNLSWFRFSSEHGYTLTGKGMGTETGKQAQLQFRPDHVRQGAMGDCWFLSALAVVAEKPYLIRKILPHDEMNDVGCYEVNFCLDGKWTAIIVDSLLPCIARTANSDSRSRNSSASRDKMKGAFQTKDGIVIQPAFAAGKVMWPAIIEKAYAKVHGSYHRLSGGFISEALYDLTGAPLERIVFGRVYDYDELFARLLSFSSSGFLMGVATSGGGDGLVSNHAYSLLGVYEVHNVVVGTQKKVTQFFANSGSNISNGETENGVKSINDDDEVIIVESHPHSSESVEQKKRTVRLVRIRNPWGVREWRGKWSAKSEQWTEKIRKHVGEDICKHGDGTFFMSYEDMIQRFDHMDVAKCQEGWHKTSRAGAMKLHPTGDALRSCSIIFHCSVEERTWAFISLVQRKKRANATSQFWYTDFSMIILKRKRHDDHGEWTPYKCILQGVERACDCEIFWDPLFVYCIIPFSFLSGRGEIDSTGAQVERKRSAPFQFTTYSANIIQLKPQVRSSIGLMSPLESLHRTLLQSSKKISHAIGKGSLLVVVSGRGCIYFVILNASTCGVLFHLQVELNRGLSVAHGENNQTTTLPPRTQSIVFALTNDGCHPTPGVNYNFKTDSINNGTRDTRIRGHSAISGCSAFTTPAYCGVQTHLQLSLAGDLLCSEVDSKEDFQFGKGTIDERLWNNGI